MAQTMKDILNRMLNHEELSREEMKNILIGITQSEYPTEQITALLTALQMRGVTVDELLGFRDGILETGVPAILNAGRYIDVVGTGGDRKVSSFFRVEKQTGERIVHPRNKYTVFPAVYIGRRVSGLETASGHLQDSGGTTSGRTGETVDRN